MVGVRTMNGRYYAKINCNGHTRALGGYATELEAHRAYVREARRIYGDWMHPSLLESASVK